MAKDGVGVKAVIVPAHGISVLKREAVEVPLMETSRAIAAVGFGIDGDGRDAGPGQLFPIAGMVAGDVAHRFHAAIFERRKLARVHVDQCGGE